MFTNLTGWHLIIILAIVLLIFGATRLPALARGLGQSVKIFRTEMDTAKDLSPDVVSAEPSDSSSTHEAPRTPKK